MSTESTATAASTTASFPSIPSAYFINDEVYFSCCGHGKIILDKRDSTNGTAIDGRTAKQLYVGGMQSWIPHGKGRAYRNGWIIDAHWTCGQLSSWKKVHIRNETDATEIEGIVMYSTQYYAKLIFSTITKNGIIIFEGYCGFLLDMKEGIMRESGLVFVNGKPRIRAEFDTLGIHHIEEVYDDNGILAIKAIAAFSHDGSINEDGQILHFDDLYPQCLTGAIEVYDHRGVLLYTADYDKKGHMKNMFTTLNNSPLMELSAQSTPTDFITFESIDFGEICYAFNSPSTKSGDYQVVSQNSLIALERTSRGLLMHPLTRSPVWRIFRLKFTPEKMKKTE